MAWIDRCSIATKFSLLLWLPFGLLLLAAASIIGKQGVAVWQQRHLPKTAQLVADGRRLVLALQQERQGLLTKDGQGDQAMSLTMASDLAMTGFLAAQGRWLGEREVQAPELLMVNGLLARLAWMRSAWLNGELPREHLLGHYEQSVAALIDFESRMLTGLPHAWLADGAQALGAVARAQERLSLLQLAPSAGREQRLRREFNLYLDQYRGHLNAKSTGLGETPLSRSLPLAGRAGLSDHLTQQSQWMVQQLQAFWRGSLLTLGWMILPLLLTGVAWRWCHRLTGNLRRRITGLSLAVRALDQQRAYHLRLAAGDQDELDTMIHHLNGVIDDACQMRAELQIARQQLKRVRQDTPPTADPKVTPILARREVPSVQPMNQS
ncbi:hypothetical protein FCL40_15790 [Ferrimonas sediminicola]|uniref:Uncharacterized protein n=1 Tax=Ferrimonas sediminicola TaxID=2569538 RepID=A0A4V5NUQ0_9GAMM|nr:hypothetical protein [Ferrimonas sediminicola]TKB47312.1 hypothetical protein FCL40_15790 [Ferrimonas sediminicola]